MTRQLDRRSARLLVVVVAALISAGLMSGGIGAATAVPAPIVPCAAQQAAVDGMEAKRLAHNNEPHVFKLPEQQALFNAYNARRQQLIVEYGQKETALDRCLDALKQLQDESNSTYRPDFNDKGARAIIDKLAQVPKPPSTYTPPPAPGFSDRALVPKTSPVRPYYDLIRQGNPQKGLNETLQGKTKPRIGDPDPAFPNQPIRSVKGQPDVSADHIVPLSDLVNLPGFTKLSPENMWLLSRAPLNLQWLSRTANRGKNSGLAGRVDGADPAWMDQQIKFQLETRQKLIDLIKRLNGETP